MPPAAIVAGGLALLIRETALPMILAMGGLALLERRWREALGWAAAVALFASRSVPPRADGRAGRPTRRPRLARLERAARRAVRAAGLRDGVERDRAPAVAGHAVILLSLFGWASVATGWALRVTLLLLGYGVMLALFARADTFYWALLVAPCRWSG